MRSILILSLVLFVISLTAQKPGPRHGNQAHKHEKASTEKLEAQKIAFFTTKLELSPQEAQAFWPVYNEYSAAKKNIRMQGKEKPNLQEISNEEAELLIEEHLARKQKELEIDQEYVVKFKQVLPSKKVIHIFILERRFKEEMLRHVRKRLNSEGK